MAEYGLRVACPDAMRQAELLPRGRPWALFHVRTDDRHAGMNRCSAGADRQVVDRRAADRPTERRRHVQGKRVGHRPAVGIGHKQSRPGIQLQARDRSRQRLEALLDGPIGGDQFQQVPLLSR